jgi:hypothetical protein
MAKSSGKTGGTSRIRFIMFDAEIPDGEIHSVTQAISNALRGPNTVVKRIAAPQSMNGHAEQTEPEVVEEEADELEAVDVMAQATSRPRAPRKAAKAPDIVDIDMDSDMSLATFASGRDSSSQHKKYLIAAAWLKERRSIDAVSAGHIYTCFRSMDWSVAIPDFWQPLRDLKAKKYFVKNDNGEYEINHIGLAYVKKLGGGNGTD